VPFVLPEKARQHACLARDTVRGFGLAMLALEGLERPEPGPGELAFPLERRFGRMQLDDDNLYAKTFSLRFSDTGTTRKFYPATTDRH
jgi:hypothetical protein